MQIVKLILTADGRGQTQIKRRHGLVIELLGHQVILEKRCRKHRKAQKKELIAKARIRQLTDRKHEKNSTQIYGVNKGKGKTWENGKCL